MDDNAGFYAFCAQSTDRQLVAILAKEWAAGRADDYAAAKLVAAERGWRVSKGQRIG